MQAAAADCWMYCDPENHDLKIAVAVDLGLSPDNGDGSTEVLWLAVLATILIIGILIVRNRRRQNRIFIDKKR